MNIFELTNRLKFHNYFPFDQKVQTMFADMMVAIKEWDRMLADVLNSAECKLDRQRFLVNTFEKTGTEFSMDAYGDSDNLLGDF